MIRSYLLICIFHISLISFGQDSVRVTLCETSGPICYSAYPSLNKTIDRYDSLGFLYKSSSYHFERCDEDYLDTAFIHSSDIYYAYDTSGNLIFENQYNFYSDTVVFQLQTDFTYDTAGHQLTQL